MLSQYYARPATAPAVRFLSAILLAALAACSSDPPEAIDPGGSRERLAPPGRQRVVVLTDIGNEPDDAQSLVRFLVYSNEMDVEGLLATTSTWLRNEVHDDRIRGHIRAYADVRDHLLRHAAGYPPADSLAAVVRACRPVYGMDGVGDGLGTDGSEHIIRVVDRDDPRPVWVTVWGGSNCLAQALWDVRAARTPEEVAAFVAKLRVYAISDQDDSGPWLRAQFPGLFYIVSPTDPNSADGYRHATWVGISGDKFHGHFTGPDFALVDNPWLRAHVRTGHGPLGERYPATEYLMEGDTPSFLNLFQNGLAGYVNPGYGGWGGRYRLARPDGEPRPIWTNAADRVTAHDGTTYTTDHATIWRWREAYQYDFAARMDWSRTPRFEEANHPPRLTVNGDTTAHPVYLTAAPGAFVPLSADGSADPDPGDALAFAWWVYPEAGTYPGAPPLASPATMETTLTVPPDAAGTEIHVILEATDTGTPPLTTYRRIVVTVSPT